MNNFLINKLTSSTYRMGLGRFSRDLLSYDVPRRLIRGPDASESVQPGDSFLSDCTNAFQTEILHHDPTSPAGQFIDICELLNNEWKNMLGQDSEVSGGYIFSDEGDNCSHGCALSSEKSSGGFSRRTHILMQHHVVIARMAVAWGLDNTTAVLYVDPRGEAEALEWRTVRRSLETGDLMTYFSIFDSSLKVLERGSSIVESASCAADMRVRTAQIQKRISDVSKNCRGMLIEDDIECDKTYLADRYDRRASWAESTHEDGEHTCDFFSGEYNYFSEGELLESQAESHSADMAEIMTAGLPDVRFAILPRRDLAYHGSDARTLSSWSCMLSRYKPRVVNISQVFGRLIPDCESLFGTLFSRFPDVLFVAGAGNNGVGDGINLCPASLMTSYANFVTVAGQLPGGQLANFSNHGSSIATVAAPSSVMIRRGGQATDGVVVHGTSVSAALVSNLALDVFSQSPGIKPFQFIDKLMESCGRQNLDVTCGGAIDAGAVRAWGRRQRGTHQ